MIETLFWTVMFCLGWRMITSEGQLLYFLRKPFEGLSDKIDNARSVAKNMSIVSKLNMEFRLVPWEIKYFIATPLVLCITCMASIWGVSVFVALNGFSKDLIIPMILNSFAAAFIQTFIWQLYDRYIR